MQAQVNPALGALLQTAQMVTPEQTPTVAAQVAQVAAQKMQPQGIMGGMPQARQDFRTAAEIDNMKRMQMQQAMQQMAAQMTARPAGIEGLPAQNMQTFASAQGGVVGYAEGGTPRTYGYAPDYEDARRLGISLSPYDSPEVRQQKLERLQKMREFEEQRKSFGEIPTEASQANERALAQAFSPAAQERRMLEVPTAPGRTAAPPMAASPEGQRIAQAQNAPTQFNVGVGAIPALQRAAQMVGGKEREDILNKIAELQAAQPSQSAPTGIAAALAERPQYDVASIAAAGAPYMKAGEEDVARLRKAEGERAAFEKTLPDLSAKGIAALETAEQERQRLLGVQRGDDKFNRQIALLRGFQGDRAAYDRVVAAQQARDDLARQAQLSFEQARIKEMQAQQARQLNQFDRAIGLEREASALMEKARDNALKAQQIQQGVASAQFQGAVQMRGQDISSEDRAVEAALRRLPSTEQQMAERVMNDFLARNPGKTLSDAWDFYRGAGKGLDLRETSVELKALKDEEAQLLKRLEATFSQKERQPIIDRLDQISKDRVKMMGGAPAPSAPTQLPPGVKVTRVGP